MCERGHHCGHRAHVRVDLDTRGARADYWSVFVKPCCDSLFDSPVVRQLDHALPIRLQASLSSIVPNFLFAVNLQAFGSVVVFYSFQLVFTLTKCSSSMEVWGRSAI